MIDMITLANEQKHIAQILVEERTFMIQQDAEQEVIEPTQTAEQQNMIHQEEKSEVIDKIKLNSKDFEQVLNKNLYVLN